MTTSLPWPADRFARALALVEEGLTYSEVGARLGVSKNAIAGILFRRGYTRLVAPSLEERLGWARVTRTGCRWIEGHPGEAGRRWCGGELAGHGPYSAEHQAAAWARPKEAA